MKNINIESLYYLQNKNINLVQGYTEIPYMAFIMKACRLKPYSYVFEKRSNNIVLERKWFDEFYNSLIIKKTKVNIIYNDLTLDRDLISCTDMYYGLSMNKISKMSKNVYITYGHDEDLFQDCASVSFLGIDNFIRTYVYYYGEWIHTSPLILGLKTLVYIVSNRNSKLEFQTRLLKSILVPCTSGRAWLSSLPIEPEFLKTLERQCGIVASIFK